MDRDFKGRTGAIAYVHQHTAQTISHFDNKAYLFIAIASAVLVYLLQQDDLKRAIVFLCDFEQIDFQQIQAARVLDLGLAGAAALAAALAALFFGLSIFHSVSCLSPRRSPGSKVRGHIFFLHVAAAGSSEDYAREVSEMDEDRIAAALSRDSYNLAGIAKTKFGAVRRASGMLFLAGFLVLGFELLRLVASVPANT